RNGGYMVELYEIDGLTYAIEIKKIDKSFIANLNGKEYVIEARSFENGNLILSFGNETRKFSVLKDGKKRFVFHDSNVYEFLKKDVCGSYKKIKEEENELDGKIIAPMTAKIVKFLISAGEAIKSKQEIVILESMKMEYRIEAPFNSFVKRVNFNAGDTVNAGDILIELESES
ncbi:MAG: biotin/lipoyl-containing protein, partial [Candidatus Thermoplasmatota archaeon]